MSSCIYLVILFVILSCSLSCTNAEFRIVNGYYIGMQDSPHAVAIFICEMYSCVGTLVTLKSVVTVANCVFRVQPRDLDVLAGMVDLREFGKKGQKHTAQSIIPYPSFTRASRDVDIAVVKVEIAFQETWTVKPVNLCGFRLELGMDMIVSGWGAVTFRGRDNSIILKSTTMSMIRKDECQNSLNTLPSPISLTNTIICAKGAMSSYIGFGDAGAGAIVADKLCAVVRDGCRNPNMPDLFTDVTNPLILDFLNSNI